MKSGEKRRVEIDDFAPSGWQPEVAVLIVGVIVS